MARLIEHGEPADLLVEERDDGPHGPVELLADGPQMIQELSLHLLTQTHDLPGHFAVLSVIEAGGHVRDDFDADRPIEGR